jgi:hypothetical protein
VNKNNLLTAGLIAYLCEGTKLRKNNKYKNTYYYSIEFTNSDPFLIKLFVEFLRTIVIIKEPKLKCQIFIYNDLKKEDLESFWSKITGIKLSNFNKTIILKPKNMTNKLNLRGTCKLRYHDKSAFLKLNKLIIKNIGAELNLIK